MKQRSGKALYLLLTSILGIILLILLQRAAFSLYVILSDYSLFKLSGVVDPLTLQAIDSYSMLAALVLGGWYGIWLGLNWHEELYGDGRSPRLLHRFLPHSMRAGAGREVVEPIKKVEVSTQIRPVAKKTVTKKVTPKVSSLKQKEIVAWSFEDLEKTLPDKKSSVKKPRAPRAKKTVEAVQPEANSVIAE